MPNSSFFVDGETYSTALVSSGDQPGTLTPSQAPSSFYPDGQSYAQDNPDLSSKFADLAAASAAAALASQNAAKTSETNAAASAASASSHDSSSQTQAQNAYTNAQSAFSSAGAAATSATTSATSATQAATSASNAATSETNAAGSATAASGSASAAAGSAGAASTSASNAHTSELNAATSATNAAASVQAVAGTATPLQAGTAAVGTSTKWAHEDHRHPADTTTADARVAAAAGTATPLVDGTAAVGVGTKWAHEDHVHPTDTSRAPLASPTFTGAPKSTTPTNGDNSTNIATTAFVQTAISATGAVLRSYLAGLTLSTAGSSTAFSVAAGVATDSTNAGYLTLASALAKSTGSWAVGAAAGALDTGTIIASRCYHVFLIKRVDTGVVDVLISLSATAPTLPTSYTLFRRIGSLFTNASSQWALFSQQGDEFLWVATVQKTDINTTTQSTTPVAYTLSVPTGVKVVARVRGYAATGSITVVSPDENLQTGANGTTGNLTAQAASGGVPAGLFTLDIRTNVSGQIWITAAGASTQVVAVAYGWIDRRGRDD